MLPVPDDTALARLPSASFAGIPFIAERIVVKGSLRYHDHEYLKRPGAQPEKQMRRLYDVAISASFHEHFEGAGKDGFPYQLDRLLRLFERGESQPLVVPGLGVLEAAFCANWSTELVALMRSGVSADLQFHEDSTAETLAELVDLRQETLATRTEDLRLEVAALDTRESLLDVVLGLLSDIQGYRDQTEFYAELVAAKVTSLLGALTELERGSPLFDRPEHWPLIRAALLVGASARALADDVLALARPVRFFRTERRTTMSELAVRFYGASDRAVELLRLNSDVVDDPFDVGVGVTVRYYA